MIQLLIKVGFYLLIILLLTATCISIVWLYTIMRHRVACMCIKAKAPFAKKYEGVGDFTPLTLKVDNDPQLQSLIKAINAERQQMANLNINTDEAGKILRHYEELIKEYLDSPVLQTKRNAARMRSLSRKTLANVKRCRKEGQKPIKSAFTDKLNTFNSAISNGLFDSNITTTQKMVIDAKACLQEINKYANKYDNEALIEQINSFTTASNEYIGQIENDDNEIRNHRAWLIIDIPTIRDICAGLLVHTNQDHINMEDELINLLTELTAKLQTQTLNSTSTKANEMVIDIELLKERTSSAQRI